MHLNPRSILSAFAFTAAVCAQTDTPAPGFRLFGPLFGTDTWLVDTNGAIVHTWPSEFGPGVGVYLEPDGTLLRTVATAVAPPTGGGGGGLQRVALDGTLLWDWRYDGPGVLAHHDIAIMPNGNVLMIAWEEKSRAETVRAGRDPATIGTPPFRPDHLIEVRQTGPTSGEIVWEWHVWDHLIQDFDPTKDNYGVVADHPEKVDINYPPQAPRAGDWNHLNGVAYDPVHDWIIMSARTQNEIWVIHHDPDHDAAEAESGLIFRWGNPQVYQRGTEADRKLFGQHAAHFIPENRPGAGNILLFNNNHPGGSAVWELEPPLGTGEKFFTDPDDPFGPARPVWEYRDPPNMRSAFVSSAERLPNGNTLICSGVQGRVFEVGANDRVVWNFQGDPGAWFFHAHYYEHSLWSDRRELSLRDGGTLRLDLVTGSQNAGVEYVTLGSMTGTWPGVNLHGQKLPLNFDSYTSLILMGLNTPVFANVAGVLDSLGRARASITIPAGLPPAVAGIELHHAFFLIMPQSHPLRTSNAVTLRLTR